MENNYKTIEYRGYNINVKYDFDPQSPREWDNLGVIYSNYRNYSPDGHSIKELLEQECYQDGNYRFAPDKFSEDYIWLRIYAYIHGGITISCGESCPYSDLWDSGLFGIIAVDKNVVRKEYNCTQISDDIRNKVIGVLESEVKTLDDYYTGSVYGFEVTKINNDDEVLDSCWGYYGDDSLEDIEAECKSVIDGFIQKEKQARLNYLRQRIKERGIQLCLPFLDYPQTKVSI